jgi:hypothetical protein
VPEYNPGITEYHTSITWVSPEYHPDITQKMEYLVALQLEFQVLPQITHWSQALQSNTPACLLAV